MVIGNLDLALQVADEASIKRSFDIINALSQSYGTRRYGGRTSSCSPISTRWTGSACSATGRSAARCPE